MARPKAPKSLTSTWVLMAHTMATGEFCPLRGCSTKGLFSKNATVPSQLHHHHMQKKHIVPTAKRSHKTRQWKLDPTPVWPEPKRSGASWCFIFMEPKRRLTTHQLKDWQLETARPWCGGRFEQAVSGVEKHPVSAWSFKLKGAFLVSALSSLATR